MEIIEKQKQYIAQLEESITKMETVEELKWLFESLYLAHKNLFTLFQIYGLESKK